MKDNKEIYSKKIEPKENDGVKLSDEELKEASGGVTAPRIFPVA